MALSNILREPRREITETTVGVLIVGTFLFADFRFAVWLQNAAGGWDQFPWPIAMVFGIALAAVLVVLAFITHAIGQGICNALERNGIRLRPRTRYH